MHFKMLNIAGGVLHSNHTEIIFFENYSNSSQFMEILRRRERNKGLREGNDFFADEFPYKFPHYSHVFNFAMWDDWVLAIYFFFPLVFFSFLQGIAHDEEASRKRDLLHSPRVGEGKKLFLWINSIFLLRRISSFPSEHRFFFSRLHVEPEKCFAYKTVPLRIQNSK